MGIGEGCNASFITLISNENNSQELNEYQIDIVGRVFLQYYLRFSQTC